MAQVMKLAVLAVACMTPAMAAAPDAQAMNQPHKPFRIVGNTYYVGTAGISSLLVTSEYGHVLVDAGLAISAPLIASNIEALGFKLADVKAIVFSHPHPDHVGGIAELQRRTGAQVYGLRAAESVLRTGKLDRNDPSYGVGNNPIPKVERSWIVTDGQLLGVGSVRLRVHATPGHTPASATWTWDACEGSKCLAFVYADSLNPVSGDKYKFKAHPQTVQAFEASLAKIEALPCDLLMTGHHDAATLARLEAAKGDPDALKDPQACKGFAQQRREALQKRLADEG
jgi:metallo-beta-lactamase class B